ncbi:MAG: hypothetical protein ACRDQ0_10550 [Pseudonocardia sp.]
MLDTSALLFGLHVEPGADVVLARLGLTAVTADTAWARLDVDVEVQLIR